MDTDNDPTPQNAGPVEPPANEAERAALLRRHETTDVGVRGLFIFAGTLLVVLFFVLVGNVVFFKGNEELVRFLNKRRAQGEQGADSLVRVQPDYQGPLLQVYPENDLYHLRQADAGKLDDYGWIDRDKGLVRLPINRAMDLVAQRGLPPVSPGLTVEQIQAHRADPQVYGQSLRP